MALVFRITGGSNNDSPQLSLGGILGGSVVISNILNNLFSDVLPDFSASGGTIYRALDIYNSGATLATGITLYISYNTTCTQTAIALGADATNNPHSSTATLETIINENTAPIDIIFSTPSTASKLSLDSIPAGQADRIWIRLVINTGISSFGTDTFCIKVDYT